MFNINASSNQYYLSISSSYWIKYILILNINYFNKYEVYFDYYLKTLSINISLVQGFFKKITLTIYVFFIILDHQLVNKLRLSY